jgi:hypothetical protein
MVFYSTFEQLDLPGSGPMDRQGEMFRSIMSPPQHLPSGSMLVKSPMRCVMCS